ncbi:MAG: hypothetical protein ABL899_02755 [Nitrospira sp.]
MNNRRLYELALIGAKAEYSELEKNIGELKGYIRNLADLDPAPENTPAPAKKKAKKRKPMSAAQKRQIGIRMKKYWADRRKATAGKK